MAKKQRVIGADKNDRFVMTCSKEIGDRIRRLSDKLNVTYSRFIADIVESRLGEIEASVEADELQ